MFLSLFILKDFDRSDENPLPKNNLPMAGPVSDSRQGSTKSALAGTFFLKIEYFADFSQVPLQPLQPRNIFLHQSYQSLMRVFFPVFYFQKKWFFCVEQALSIAYGGV
ncbi:hypothetical protein EGR_08684 [Echinococcus granulosus]|uniref:Uncharacterized protein n=1 Tax=Echinococcus granulosus TaxID=6210 RepID=W6UEG0_ECHGR|nr:hypothetical protein EGR_08684 [Echinococcus granulosus]EUB56462.1 hypothetical protein EGR_08684 [Echinococcus granulosus]